MRKLILTLGYDSDVECPNDEECQWTLYSFNRRHLSYKDPYNLIFDDNGNLRLGIQAKLKAQTAFFLDYYEHGLCQWTLAGEGIQCRWDSVGCAGILLWEHDPSELPRGNREKDARGFCEYYTDWANGNCYWFALDTLGGESLDSCGGFIGDEAVAEAIRESMDEDDLIVRVEGEAKWLADHFRGVNIDTDQDFDGEYDS